MISKIKSIYNVKYIIFSVSISIISIISITPRVVFSKPPTPANVCFTATVDRVIDGDTLSVKTPEGLERIRISQIDAPEQSQAFGLEATQCLTGLVKNYTLNICSDGQDQYGRTIAEITVKGKNIGRLMVEQGCAWAYTKYLKVGSDLPAIQENAKQSSVGLWASHNAYAPWNYRADTATTTKSWNRIFDWAE